MNSFKIGFEQISQDAALSDMLCALERGFQKYSIDYYLVGAVSRDVWMRGIHNIAPRRTTGDIDFAVFINDKGVYEQLKEHLIAEEGFTGYKKNGFVLIYKDGTEVDLLPFGAIEDENRTVTIKSTGYTSINVEGFREVYQQALPEINLEGHIFKVCTLPGIVLLKLIAWNDRPEARQDDIKDISDILNNFFTMYCDTIWDKHHDLFNDDSDNLLTIAARVLGREIGEIIIGSEKLYNLIQSILETNTQNPDRGTIAILMQQYFDNTMEECTALIAEIKKGINDISKRALLFS